MARESRGFQGSAPLMEKKSFLTSSEGAVASYNGIDISTGKGYAIYYLADDIKGTEFLTPEVVISSTGSALNYPSAIDLDFDITIGHPFIIEEGDIFVGLSCADSSGAAGGTPTVTVTLSIVDGDTLATGNSGVALPIGEWKYALFKLTGTKKSLKVGDVLRLRVQMSKAASENSQSRIFFDPSDTISSTTVKTAVSYIKLPIRLDI
jgi:hypothetical protein